jgi:glycosyltransferase involved in cell wall biosynthesis
LKIGIMSQSYSCQRNINWITENDYVKINFLNLNGYFRFLSKYIKKIFKIDFNKFILTEGYKGLFFDRYFYDIAHLFNEFSLSKKPWVSTFETKIPFLKNKMDIIDKRNRYMIAKVLKACASDSCKAIIAMSKCAMRLELGLLSHFPEYENHIRKKLVHIYPPQKLFIQSFEEKLIDLHGKLKFIFVGREFYRKGGYDILRCFERLADRYDFELIIVSGLNNINRQIYSEENELAARKIIEKYNGSWLTYYSELENDAVIRLMKGCHVGLLPTYSDTFGYSVLELQACGCPTITTDVRALPEINNEDVGWIINTGDKNNHGEICDPGEILKNHIIENALEKIVTGIFQSPLIIKTKAEKAIERIRNHHSPIAYKKKIERIYRSGITQEY